MPVLAINKQAHHNYQIEDTLEAGLVLTGQEVKAIRAGLANLKGSYVSTRQTSKVLPEFYLKNATISKYQQAGKLEGYQPTQDRKILLNKREIKRLMGRLQEKGLTLVPIKIYTKKGLLKLEIALAKGKKNYDKKEDLKKRDLDRDLRRTLKNR